MFESGPAVLRALPGLTPNLSKRSDMDDATPECWLPVPGHEGLYEVSDLGRVRSLERLETVTRQGRSYIRRRRERLLRATPDPDGYLKVRLYRDSVPDECKVHILVLTAFVGPRPDGMLGRHINDVNADNWLANLAWGTPSDNMQDLQRNGRNWNLNKTHCPQKHKYTPENTRVRGSGWRDCRRCHADRERAKRQQRKDAA